MKKIEKMHFLFGEQTGKTCGDCPHLETVQTGNRAVRKCQCYGVSPSSSTDWAKKYTSCGLFGKETNVRHAQWALVTKAEIKEREGEKQLDGQNTLF